MKCDVFLVTEHFAADGKPLDLHSSLKLLRKCHGHFKATCKSTQTTKGHVFGRWTQKKFYTSIKVYLALYDI